MNRDVQKPEDLGREELVRLAVDMLHRTAVHHGLWFAEVQHQMGREKANEIMGEVWKKSFVLQMERLAAFFGFAVRDGIPEALWEMPEEKLLLLLQDLAKNWIAGDGIWFQALEADYGIWEAKRCNDSCWSSFSPFEASSIKRFLRLPPAAGLAGLKQALQFRLYARLNVQTIVDEGLAGVVLQMNACRVQTARVRKGLDDYPCKSAGVVEYRAFAETIDGRIRTACIGCPPDEHPPEWFCAWRFTLAEEEENLL